MWAIAIFLFSAWGAPGSPILESFQVNPDWTWKTIETEHFRVSFNAPLEDVARRCSRYLEEAHSILSPKFQHSPSTKTQVLVVDNTDISNGATAALYRLGLVLQITPPGPESSLGYFNQWLRTLVLHEYVHMLHLDTTEGIWEVFRVLSGETIAGVPNHMLPPWMLEGFAVYLETVLARDGIGRGGSPFYEMILRSAVESGSFDTAGHYTLDRVHVESPLYPGGEVRYLYGYYLIKELVESVGTESVLSEASHANIPVFLDLAIQSPAFESWQGIWDSFVKKTRTRIGGDLQKLRATPITPTKTLEKSGYDPQSMRVSQDQRTLVFEDTSIDRVTRVASIDLSTGEKTTYERLYHPTGFTFLPNSQLNGLPGGPALVYADVRQVDQYHQTSDLFLLDLKSKKTVLISDGLRAKYPDISPDGRSIVFVQNSGGTNWLSLADIVPDLDRRIALKNIRTLWKPPGYSHVFSPRFSPDGGRIVFSLRDETKRGMKLVEISALGRSDYVPTVLLDDGAFNRFPSFATDGSIAFVSDKTGVDNAYLLQSVRGKTAQPQALTHLTTGIWHTEIAGTALYGSVYADGGWQVSRASNEIGALPPKLDQAQRNALPPSVASEVPTDHHLAQDHSLWPSLLPRIWLPGFAFSNLTSRFNVGVLGFDSIDRHNYFLTGLFDTRTASVFGSARYTLQAGRLFWTVAAQSSLNWTVATSSGTIYERQGDVSFSVHKPLPGTFSNMTAELSGGLSTTARYNASTNHTLVSDASSPISPTEAYPLVSASLYFADTAASRMAISPELGKVIQLSFQQHFLATEPFVSKLSLSVQPYVELLPHWSWSPYVQMTFASRVPATQGAQARLLNRRGYRNLLVAAKTVGLVGIENQFPIWRPFRGLSGINPLGLRTLSGYVFGEGSVLPGAEIGTSFLPTVGAGIKIGLAFVPLQASIYIEFEYGLLSAYGGGPNYSLGIQL